MRQVGDIARGTVDRILAENRETLRALYREATESGDHARAAWIANKIQEMREQADETRA